MSWPELGVDVLLKINNLRKHQYQKKPFCDPDGLRQKEDHAITMSVQDNSMDMVETIKITNLLPFLVKMSDHYVLFCFPITVLASLHSS